MSAIAEHSIDQGHRIQFHSSSISATKTRYVDRIVREAILIELTHTVLIDKVAFVSVNHGSLLLAP
jgi:hypothetical protein